MATSKSLLSIFTGQRAQFRVVGKSWGMQRPDMVQSADWTPNLNITTIEEFDNLLPALMYTTFNDVTFKMAYPQNNQMIIESVLADWDSSQDVLQVMPENMVPFTAFANLRGLDGNIKGCWIVRDITPNGNPWTGTVKEAAQRTLEGKGLQASYYHGLAMLYTRFRGANTMQAAPAVPTLSASSSGGSLGADTYYVVITAVTAAGETQPSPEAVVQITSGTANEIAVTIPTTTSPVTGYNIYVMDRSNKWLYAGNTATTSFTITALPSANANRPPMTNTSGVPAVANDVVLTSGSGLYTGALAQPAYTVPQTGLSYALVRQNGITIASPNTPATLDTFAITSAGTTFSVLDSNAPNEWYDVFTLYKPNPA